MTRLNSRCQLGCRGVGVALAAVVMTLAGGAAVHAAATALPSRSDAVMGFEDVSAWRATRGSVAGTPVRTQGASALELRDSGRETELRSDEVASTATALAGLGDDGSSLALDLLLSPRRDRDDDDDRNEDDDAKRQDLADALTAADLSIDSHDSHTEGLSIEILANCPSRGLSRVRFRPSGKHFPRVIVLARTYTTVRFDIPAEVRDKLAAAPFDDLVFLIRVRLPEKWHGSWRLDHLRVHSPGAPLPEAGRSANLLAGLSYTPPSSTPGDATFPVGLVQIPRELHVKAGSAGHGSARLELGFGTDVFTTCSFRAVRWPAPRSARSTRPHGNGYQLTHCSGGLEGGDLVAADHARLTLFDGDPGTGPTKVLAQLAVNPLGDTAGAGLLPPMPTFWGDTPDEASVIATRYFDQVNEAPKTEERWITAPAPDFALRHGDGSPHDNLTGPPPPGDPPFDQEGHLNEGGNWDGYWRLAGNLVADNSANRAKTHLDARLGAHTVAWGHDVDVASVSATIDTDYGQLDNGLAGSSATGGLHLFLFGVEVADKPFTSGSSVTFDLDETAPFDLPPVQIWIFQITIGLRAEVSAKGSAAISPAGLSLLFTPKASVAAHLEGDVSIGVASGGVAADIDLIAVDTPFRAMAGWAVSTDPHVCAATLGFRLDGDLNLTSLGGKVDLVATLGVCPLCDHESYTIYKWDGLNLATLPLFHVSASGQVFPLPRALCLQPLVVSIDFPPGGANLIAGIPYTLSGRAAPKATPTNPVPPGVDCAGLAWSTDDPVDKWLPVPTGCQPVLALDGARLGSRTISLHASDAFGETGDATPVSIQVVAQSPNLQAVITAPPDQFQTLLGTSVRFSGGASGASSAAVLTWTATPLPPPAGSGGPPVIMGQGPFVDWVAPAAGGWTVTLSVQDGTSTASSSITVFFFTLT